MRGPEGLLCIFTRTTPGGTKMVGWPLIISYLYTCVYERNEKLCGLFISTSSSTNRENIPFYTREKEASLKICRTGSSGQFTILENRAQNIAKRNMVWKQAIPPKKWQENFPATKSALLFMPYIIHPLY